MRTLFGATPSGGADGSIRGEYDLRHLGRSLTTIAGIWAMAWFTRSIPSLLVGWKELFAILRTPCSLYTVSGSAEHIDWRPFTNKRLTGHPHTGKCRFITTSSVRQLQNLGGRKSVDFIGGSVETLVNRRMQAFSRDIPGRGGRNRRRW